MSFFQISTLVAFFLASVPGQASISLAAEYYYSNHDYGQALQLWREALKQQPGSLVALVRVAELTILLEGRDSAHNIFDRALREWNGDVVVDSRGTLRDHVERLQTLFVTEEGQSRYLQGLSKVRGDDCAAAMPLFERSRAAEKGNTLVLKAMAKCERKLGLFGKLSETVRVAYESNPFDQYVLHGLIESLIYSREYPKIITIYRKHSEAFKTNNQKIGIALALSETGYGEEAIKILQPITSSRAGSVNPIAYYIMGKALLLRPSSRTEAKQYLQRFVSSNRQGPQLGADGWDLYRVAERLEELKRENITQ